LIDVDSPVLAAMTNEVSLPIAVYVKPTHHASALDGVLPSGSVDGLTPPRNILWQADVD
jgi:hypothetical protein